MQFRPACRLGEQTSLSPRKFWSVEKCKHYVLQQKKLDIWLHQGAEVTINTQMHDVLYALDPDSREFVRVSHTGPGISRLKPLVKPCLKVLPFTSTIRARVYPQIPQQLPTRTKD